MGVAWPVTCKREKKINVKERENENERTEREKEENGMKSKGGGNRKIKWLEGFGKEIS